MLTMNGVERSYASAIGETMRNLTVQAEVGSVMEGMLGDLEAWEWANKEEALKVELEHARAQVQVLQESEKALLEVRAAAFSAAGERRTSTYVTCPIIVCLESVLVQQQAAAWKCGNDLACSYIPGTWCLVPGATYELLTADRAVLVRNNTMRHVPLYNPPVNQLRIRIYDRAIVSFTAAAPTGYCCFCTASEVPV